MTHQIQATRVQKQIAQAEKDGAKIIINQGGSRSSKTWSILLFLILKALAGEKITVTIVRSSLSWIKLSLLKDLEQIQHLYPWIPIEPDVKPTRHEQTYYINGSEFSFFGLDYAEKLHGRSQDWFWINEAMEVSKKHFDQLEMRTRIGGIIDYNPIDDNHWVFSLAKRTDTALIVSTQLDNPFLAQPIRDKILSYEPTAANIAQGTADQYMWQVYGLGEKAKLQGAIFAKWDIVSQLPAEAKFLAYGLDFGYSADPSCMISLSMMNGELYIQELLYEQQLTNTDIADRFSVLEIANDSEIYADSSEPKSIEELYRLGYNVHPATKGADSVRYGIDILLRYQIHITQSSVNLENELRKYRWATDKAGNALQKPVDAFNHAIDALRYAAMMTLDSSSEVGDNDFDVI